MNEHVWLDLAGWLACVDADDVEFVSGCEALKPAAAARLSRWLGDDWRTHPVFAEVALVADFAADLELAVRRQDRIARVSAMVAGLSPLAGWWLGARLGEPWLGLLLGVLWSGGVPSVLAAWCWRESRRLRGLLAELELGRSQLRG